MDVFNFTKGNIPLLISVPHAGTYIPDDIKKHMTDNGQDLLDTDRDVDKLYGFATDMGANMLVANYSRYVVDLNRSEEDDILYSGQVKTGLCPTQTFQGKDIYSSGYVLDNSEIQNRIKNYWKPYHDKVRKELDRIKKEYGHAILYDAHSIKAELPRLFEGRLPDLNLGTHNGKSCSIELENKVAHVLKESDYTYVINGRFKGGYITRHYGDPDNDTHALQMEIVQDVYIDNYEPLIKVLELVIESLSH